MGTKSKNKTSQSGPRTPTLDLHGYTTDQVFDAIDQFLMKHQNSPCVRIMTGKGSGKVKAMAVDYLKKAHYPWQYEKLPNGGVNEGVMLVFVE